MVAGLRHLGRRPAAAAVLLTQAAHWMLFGLLSIMTLLLYRNHFKPDDPDAAIVGLIAVAAAAALGALTAAVITPPLVRRLGAARWLVLLTAGVGVVVPLVGLPFVPSLTVVAAFVTSLGAQGTKIVTDTTLQLEVADDFRGRVFSVNDTGFNLLYVTGLLIGAAVLPPSGVSAAVMVFAGLGYLVVAMGYAFASRRIRA
jgi:MFS family permease